MLNAKYLLFCRHQPCLSSSGSIDIQSNDMQKHLQADHIIDPRVHLYRCTARWGRLTLTAMPISCDERCLFERANRSLHGVRVDVDPLRRSTQFEELAEERSLRRDLDAGRRGDPGRL